MRFRVQTHYNELQIPELANMRWRVASYPLGSASHPRLRSPVPEQANSKGDIAKLAPAEMGAPLQPDACRTIPVESHQAIQSMTYVLCGPPGLQN